MKVNDQPVVQGELDAVTDEIIAQAPPEMAHKIEALRPQIREKAREELIMRVILKQAMQREAIEPSPERIEAEVAAIDEYLKARALSLDQYMQASKTSPEAVRKEVREKLDYEMLYDKLLALQPPSDAEARAYYEKNLERYSRPRAAKMSEILLLFPEVREPKREETTELRARMQGYARRLEAGEDFAKLATEVSQGPTAAQGGDMGWIFPDSQLPPQIIEAAFAQDVGRPGQVVKSIFGLHIFLVTQRREAEQLPYEQVHTVVNADILRERRTAHVPGLLKRLRRQAKIENAPFSEATEIAPVEAPVPTPTPTPTPIPTPTTIPEVAAPASVPAPETPVAPDATPEPTATATPQPAAEPTPAPAGQSAAELPE